MQVDYTSLFNKEIYFNLFSFLFLSYRNVDKLNLNEVS